jgi:hypothetical protein
MSTRQLRWTAEPPGPALEALTDGVNQLLHELSSADLSGSRYAAIMRW